MKIITTITDTFKYRNKIKGLQGKIDYEALVHGRDIEIAKLQTELENAKEGIFKEKPIESSAGGLEKTKEPKKKVSFWEALGKVGELAHDFEKRMPDISGGMNLGHDVQKPNQDDLNLFGNKKPQQDDLNLFGNKESQGLVPVKDSDVKFDEIGFNINKDFQPEKLFDEKMLSHNPFDIGNGGIFGTDNKQPKGRKNKGKQRR